MTISSLVFSYGSEYGTAASFASHTSKVVAAKAQALVWNPLFLSMVPANSLDGMTIT
jgi:hypothetical protein